jgi:hypothetical protein
MHSLIAPSGWWAVVTLAFNRLATAVITRLVFAAIASDATDPLGIGAVIVMCHTARPIVIIDFYVVGVVTDAVEKSWWLDGCEKGGQGREGVRWASEICASTYACRVLGGIRVTSERRASGVGGTGGFEGMMVAVAESGVVSASACKKGPTLTVAAPRGFSSR